MRKLVARRLRNLASFIALAAVVVVGEAVLAVQLYRTSFVTGWLLLVLIVGLTTYNIRKRLPFLPLGRSSTWLQIHIYAGLLSGVVFVSHIRYQLPNGFFECVLAAMYLGVFLSGVTGLFLTRAIPRRLASRGEEVIFERIPIFLKRLRDDVEQLVFDSASNVDSTAIPDIYLNHLKAFFETPRNVLWHVLHSGRPRRRLLLEINSQHRFLNADERSVMESITDLVKVKDDLDYQFALQATLKVWLFVHVPLTYGLLVFIVYHLIVVYAFAGGNL